ncbi:hypothetical protein WN943_010885 [Citrus x changshan-huyou]
MSTFVQIKLERLRLKPYATPLHGFARGSIVSKGIIKITVSFGKSPTKLQQLLVENIFAFNESFWIRFVARTGTYKSEDDIQFDAMGFSSTIKSGNTQRVRHTNQCKCEQHSGAS